MASVMLDNSVVMTWVIEDQADPYADAVLEALGNLMALVPPIWPYEVSNALIITERRKLITPVKSDRFLDYLAALPIAVESEPLAVTLAGAVAVARRTGLSAYDASYLHLASRTGSPIATLDKAMRNAAKKAGVEVFRP